MDAAGRSISLVDARGVCGLDEQPESL